MLDGMILDEIKKINDRLEFFNLWMLLIVFALFAIGIRFGWLMMNTVKAEGAVTTTTTTTPVTQFYNPQELVTVLPVLRFAESEPPLTVKWLGRICFMRNVKIDGEKYDLPDDQDNSGAWHDVGLRSDGVVVWRSIAKKGVRRGNE